MEFGLEFFVAVLATGIGSSVLTTFFAPWVLDRVERRKEDRARKRELVQSWRDLIGLYLRGGPLDGPQDFERHEWFLSLRPYLSDDIRNEFDRQQGSGGRLIEIVAGATGVSAHPALRKLSDEVERIARDWKVL